MVCQDSSTVGALGSEDVWSDVKNKCGIGPCWPAQTLDCGCQKNCEAVSDE